MIYAGTVAASGKAKAIVTATGTNTELGKIATMVQSTEEEQTPLQVQLIVFGKWLGIILVAINVVIFVVGILTGIPLLEMFMTAVAVVVSAVPEALIPAMTVILTVGMNKLVRKNGLVRKLVAAETLGSVTVICADKTGTLTRAEMRADSFIARDAIQHGEPGAAPIHPDIKKLLEVSTICKAGFIHNNSNGEVSASGNPTDRALLLAGHEFGIDRTSLLQVSPVLDEIPFGSEHKFMATLHATADKRDEKFIYVKGAPEKILSFSKFYLNNGATLPMQRVDIKK